MRHSILPTLAYEHHTQSGERILAPPYCQIRAVDPTNCVQTELDRCRRSGKDIDRVFIRLDFHYHFLPATFLLRTCHPLRAPSSADLHWTLMQTTKIGCT